MLSGSVNQCQRYCSVVGTFHQTLSSAIPCLTGGYPPGKSRLCCIAFLIQEVFNGGGAVRSPLGDLSSCKAPTVYTNFSIGVSCFWETKKPQVPTASKEMRKGKKAQDRVQLHLPVAARPYARVGRPRSLSGLNSYGAKEEEQEPQPWAWGIWICLHVVEDPGQTAAEHQQGFC